MNAMDAQSGSDTEIDEIVPAPPRQRGRSPTRAAPRRKRHRFPPGGRGSSSSSSSSSSVSSSSSGRSQERHHSRRHRKRHQKNSRKHRRDRKRSRRRADTSSSGESTDCDTNSNNGLSDMPPISFGGKVGDSVSKSLVKRINKGKFINFVDLLPDLSGNETVPEEMFIKFGDKGIPHFEKRGKNRVITFTEWSEAFDVYMMTYIDGRCLKHNRATKTLLKDMLTYRKHVAIMMKDGGDWRGYDQHFRKLMEAMPVSWATVNFNLIWHYNNRQSKHESGKSRVHSSTQLCNKFNTPYARCPFSSATCRFQHSCAKCGSSSHPSYICSANRANGRASAVGSKPYYEARATGFVDGYTGTRPVGSGGPQAPKAEPITKM